MGGNWGAYSKNTAAEESHLGNRNDQHRGPEMGSSQNTFLGQSKLQGAQAVTGTISGTGGTIQTTPFP